MAGSSQHRPVTGVEVTNDLTHLVIAIHRVALEPHTQFAALFLEHHDLFVGLVCRCRFRERERGADHFRRTSVGAASHLHRHRAALHKVGFDRRDAQEFIAALHQRRQVGRFEIRPDWSDVGAVVFVGELLVNPNLVPRAAAFDARQNRRGERVVEAACRTAQIRQLCVVPSVLAHIVDDGVGAFGRVAAWVAPPNFAIARHLERENLGAGFGVDAVEKVIEVHLVGHLTHNAVEHQETIHAAPEENAVVIHHRELADDGGVGGDHVELEQRRAASERGANHGVIRPENARRGAAGTRPQRQPFDDLLTPNTRQPCAPGEVGEVGGFARFGPADDAVGAVVEQIRMERNHAARRIGVRRQRDAFQRRGSQHIAKKDLAASVVADALLVGGGVSDDVIVVAGRVILVIEHPQIVGRRNVRERAAAHVGVGRCDRCGGDHHQVSVGV